MRRGTEVLAVTSVVCPCEVVKSELRQILLDNIQSFGNNGAVWVSITTQDPDELESSALRNFSAGVDDNVVIVVSGDYSVVTGEGLICEPYLALRALAHRSGRGSLHLTSLIDELGIRHC